jgi:hypothetical protein
MYAVCCYKLNNVCPTVVESKQVESTRITFSDYHRQRNELWKAWGESRRTYVSDHHGMEDNGKLVIEDRLCKKRTQESYHFLKNDARTKLAYTSLNDIELMMLKLMRL